jgi:hypothetical protein
MINSLHIEYKDKITGACSFCSQAFGVKRQVEKSGIPLLSEYKAPPQALETLRLKDIALLVFKFFQSGLQFLATD